MLALVFSGIVHGEDEAPRNWFNDPFVQVSAALPGCPEPLGPRITAAERLAQSHHRAERGTTCFLRGECRQPNAYLEDPGIAAMLLPRLQRSGAAAQSTLWLTVQGRIVYLEGCTQAARGPVAAELERIARSVPQVLQAVVLLDDGQGRPPYRLR
ncbi:MAG: transporter [Rubrivivax sp.]